MNIIVNGEPRDFDENCTLSKMMESLNLVGKVMAAAVNMNIVKQTDWATYQLKEGDKIELLDFVGGG